MTRRTDVGGFAAGIVLALTVVLTAAAHAGEETARLSVEPENLQAGGTVVLAGTGLEPDSDRVLVLVGPGLTLELGTVTTDAEGMFQKEIQIPSHMPAGSYELQAIGDETLTVTLALTAAEGAPAGATGGDAVETVVPHERRASELGLIGGAAFVLFLLGVGLIRFAERFGQRPPTPLAS